MKKRGRPTRLNAELTRQFCALLSDGISITATCDALGVSQSKYFDWLKKGEECEQPYAEFREKATRARANGKIALVRQILADKDWRAKAWYLERCWSDEFARTVERPLPRRPPESLPDLSKSIKLQFPDGFMEQMHEENARMVTSLMKLLPAGAGINPRTGVITMPDRSTISPDGSEPQSEKSENETDG